MRDLATAVNAKSTWREAMAELKTRMTDPSTRQPRGKSTAVGFTTRTCAGCGEEKKGNLENSARWFRLPHVVPFCGACAKWCRTTMTKEQRADIQAAIDAEGSDAAGADAVLLDRIKNRPKKAKFGRR